VIRKLVYLSLFLAALLISACGTVVPPVWEATPTQLAAQPTQEELISLGGVRPTLPPAATVVPPTATPEPPTVTVVPTLAPTTAPTEGTTDEHSDEHSEVPASDDPFTVLVSLYDPAEGQELFNRVEPSNGYSCASCHLVNSENTLIGPGLLNISVHGAGHVEGLSAAEYIYESIVDPGAYVVPNFPDNLMPRNWHEVYNDEQIYAIVAYLLTLNG
jgi:hypothetical protein